MVQSKEFTHLNTQGEVHMVDISEKNYTQRTALAYGEIHMLEATAEAIQTQMIKKGEVLQVARVAGITASKRTFEWIPLCHLVALTKCEIQFDWRNQTCLEVRCFTKTVGSTGVEMEALTGVQATLLTIYDMCKAIDRGMTMTNIGLLEKNGGRSGHFIRSSIKSKESDE